MTVVDARPVEIRWTDVDGYGHVHHVAQLALLEHARTPFLDTLFGAETMWDYAVVRVEMNYRGELSFEDREAHCSYRVVAFGRSSITLHEAIAAPDGRPVADAVVVAVAWDPKAGSTRALTPEERGALEAAGASATVR